MRSDGSGVGSIRIWVIDPLGRLFIEPASLIGGVWVYAPSMAGWMPGVHVLRVEAVDIYGNSRVERASCSLVVLDAPISGLTATSDSPTMLHSTTHLSAAIANGTNAVFLWDLGDGTVITGSLVSHIYPSLGEFTAVVTATNESGSVSAWTLVTITKPTGELAMTPWQPTGCAGWYHSYWVTYTNVSAVVLHHVKLEVQNPAENTLVVPKESSSGLTKQASGAYAWSLGTVASGQTVTKRLVIQFFSSILHETDVTVGLVATADESDRRESAATVQVRRDGICEQPGPWPTASPTASPTLTPSPTATPVGRLALPLIYR
jgi:PKD repeat protein